MSPWGESYAKPMSEVAELRAVNTALERRAAKYLAERDEARASIRELSEECQRLALDNADTRAALAAAETKLAGTTFACPRCDELGAALAAMTEERDALKLSLRCMVEAFDECTSDYAKYVASADLNQARRALGG